MNDYMKEAERLLALHEQCAGLCRDSDCSKTRAALLAHIQRGAVPEGWQVVPKEPTPDMKAAPANDRPGFSHLVAREVYCSMLAAAPDHFRDAAGMVAVPADPDPLHLSRILHELAGAASLCWEPRPTGVFDSQLAIQFVEQALAEIRSRMMPAPAEAPMPEAVAYLYTLEYGETVAGRRLSEHQLNYPFGVCGSDYLAQTDDGVSYVRQIPLYTKDAEAAGYARGLAEAGRDAERRGQFLVECNDVALRIDPFGYGIYDAIDNDGQPYQSQALADEIAALRGEVK